MADPITKRTGRALVSRLSSTISYANFAGDYRSASVNKTVNLPKARGIVAELMFNNRINTTDVRQ